MVTPHSLRQLCFGPAAAQIDPARSARSRPFRDRLIPPNQSVTEIIIVFPAFFVNTQMKIFRLLTAFSASFFLPCPQGDFSLFSLCRLLNLPHPATPGDFAKLLAPATHYAGAPRDHGFAMIGTPGDFPVAGKVTKGAPEPTVLDSLAAKPPPFSRSLTHRAGLPPATEKDRFAALSLWANRSHFFLWFLRGNTPYFQSVARQIPYPRGCLRV